MKMQNSHTLWQRAQRQYCLLCDWFLDGPCGLVVVLAVILSPLWVLCIIFGVAKIAETHFVLALSICGALLFFITIHVILTTQRERWIRREGTIHEELSEQ